MIELLKNKGVIVESLNYGQFPLHVGISAWRDRVVIELPSGKTVQDRDLRSVLYRREASPTPSPSIQDAKIQEYIVRESENLLESLPYTLRTAWVSNPEAVKIAARKPFHLHRAADIGFQIPKTLFTNSPRQARDFVTSLGKSIAIKTLWTPGITVMEGENEQPIALYTRKLEPNQILPDISRVQNCPMIFQEYVEKKFELRVTIVGPQVFACAIWSQASPHTQEDWRRYDLQNTPHEPHQLPAKLEDLCRSLIQNLGLQFGCIDMIVTPQGEYIFLELNPNGQWLWIEQLTKMPISETLAQMLMYPLAN